jgi:hypothetical protein
MGGTCSKNGAEKCIWNICAQNGKRRLGKPKLRRVYDIKMDVREIECGDKDWVDLPQYWALSSLRFPPFALLILFWLLLLLLFYCQ